MRPSPTKAALTGRPYGVNGVTSEAAANGTSLAEATSECRCRSGGGGVGGAQVGAVGAVEAQLVVGVAFEAVAVVEQAVVAVSQATAAAWAGCRGRPSMVVVPGVSGRSTGAR